MMSIVAKMDPPFLETPTEFVPVNDLQLQRILKRRKHLQLRQQNNRRWQSSGGITQWTEEHYGHASKESMSDMESSRQSSPPSSDRSQVSGIGHRMTHVCMDRPTLSQLQPCPAGTQVHWTVGRLL